MMLAGAAQAQSQLEWPQSEAPQAEAPQAEKPRDQSAYYIDGDRLLEYCGGGDDLSRGACSGYVAGAIDMIAAINLARRRVLVCIPPEVELKQLTAVVVARLLDHPELRRYAATGQIIIALGEAYPCGADQQGPSRRRRAEQAEPPEQSEPPPQPDQLEQPEQPEHSEQTAQPDQPEQSGPLGHPVQSDRPEFPEWGRWPP